MRARRQLAALALAGLAPVLGALSACGDPDTSDSGAAPAASDFDGVVERFGRAYVTGDVQAIIPLLDPAVSGDLSAEELAAIGTLGERSGNVELRDFSYRVLERTSDKATAVYSGERCAPTAINQFPATTASGGPDDTAESSSEGQLAEGEVICTDIAATFETLPPVEFVRVDGRWYGTLAGL
jgi:hypothetical protein